MVILKSDIVFHTTEYIVSEITLGFGRFHWVDEEIKGINVISPQDSTKTKKNMGKDKGSFKEYNSHKEKNIYN